MKSAQNRSPHYLGFWDVCQRALARVWGWCRFAPFPDAMAAVLAPVTGQSVAVGHVPLRSEVGSLAVHRPGSVRGMVMAWFGQFHCKPRHSFIFSGFFFLLPKGVTVYSAPQQGMINVLSHPQLMDMIEQAEVSYKKLPGTAWKLIYYMYRAFSQSARTPEKEIKRLVPFPQTSWWSMNFLHFRHQCWKATPIAAKAAVFSKGNRCWLGDVSSREGQVISIYINWTFVFLPQNTFFILFPPPAHVKDHDHGRYAEVSHEGAKCNALLEMEAPSCCPRCCAWCCTKSGYVRLYKIRRKTSICPCLLLKWTVSDRAAGDDDDDKLKVVVRKNVLKTVCRVGLWSVVTAAGAYLFYPSLQQFLCLAEHVGKQ